MVDIAGETTYVYEGKEWELTGRTAKKAIFHKRNLNQKVGTMTIVEIAPIGIVRNDPSYFKWVDPRELFYISEVETIDVEGIKKSNDKVSDEQDD